MRQFLALLFTAVLGSAAQAQLVAPALSSRPGAAYTLYLDFTGFNYTGAWSTSGYTPGNVPAYTVDADATTFTATETANIQKTWSRVAEKYAAFSINVTTVDPAIAGGHAATDSERQNYYDATPKVMHTILGGNGQWYNNGAAGGVSYLNVISSANVSTGRHTNWVFSAEAPSNLYFLGEAGSHENGHALGLSHQSDYNGNTLVNEYSGPTNTGNAPGTVAPTMGLTYYTERGVLKIGTAHVNSGGPTIQNDVATILTSNAGMTRVATGVGQSLATATTLPHTSGAVDATSAKSVIYPNNATVANISNVGAASYTIDYWKFTTSGGLATFNLNVGRSTITAGTADNGYTLDGTLELLNASGTVLATSQTANLNETIAMVLASGNYYIRVSSAGDVANEGFFDMGSYFLTGSFAVPEPAALLGAAAAGLLLFRRRRAA